MPPPPPPLQLLLLLARLLLRKLFVGLVYDMVYHNSGRFVWGSPKGVAQVGGCLPGSLQM